MKRQGCTKTDALIMQPSQEETNSPRPSPLAYMYIRDAFLVPSTLFDPDAARGCHFFIYDSDVKHRDGGIAKTVKRIISSEERSLVLVRSGHCFNPFDGNNGHGSSGWYVETLLPTSQSRQ